MLNYERWKNNNYWKLVESILLTAGPLFWFVPGPNPENDSYYQLTKTNNNTRCNYIISTRFDGWEPTPTPNALHAPSSSNKGWHQQLSSTGTRGHSATSPPQQNRLSPITTSPLCNMPTYLTLRWPMSDTGSLGGPALGKCNGLALTIIWKSSLQQDC